MSLRSNYVVICTDETKGILSGIYWSGMSVFGEVGKWKNCRMVVTPDEGEDVMKVPPPSED